MYKKLSYLWGNITTMSKIKISVSMDEKIIEAVGTVQKSENRNFSNAVDTLLREALDARGKKPVSIDVTIEGSRHSINTAVEAAKKKAI